VTTGSTRWTAIRAAASGDAAARDEFARRYETVIRGYLESRWRGRPLAQSVDDAVQEVFVDCLRDDGALGRADSQAPGGFRAFLYGVARNVARRHEERRRAGASPPDFDPDAIEGREPTASRVFEKAWASALLAQAREEQARRAAAAGGDAVRRVELLRLRFEEGLPVRDIAARWAEDPAHVHHEYARARREFQEALREVVASHLDAPRPAAVEEECARLLHSLG
jgi:RNA polymerase sigma factor (sigma-70 family)